MATDIRPPVMAIGKDRYGDIYDYAATAGFSQSDCDIIASYLTDLWDGMDALPKAYMAFLRSDGWRLSDDGAARADQMVKKHSFGE